MTGAAGRGRTLMSATAGADGYQQGYAQCLMKVPLISILLSCALSAATAMACCWWLLRRLRTRFSLRTSAQLSAEIAQLRSDLDSISTTVRRLHAKVGMRAVRGERQEAAASSLDMQPGETRAEWKLRIKRAHFGER